MVSVERLTSIAATFLFAVVATGCVPASPIQANASNPASDQWRVGCQPDQIDPYGKLIEKAKCWAMVTYWGEVGADTAAIGVATLFEVDAKGARLVNNPDLDQDVCDEKPNRVAVDGQRIDQLPMSKRISAVLSGRQLTREIDRGWPYCNVYNETTTLTGAPQAYSEMMAMWAARAKG